MFNPGALEAEIAENKVYKNAKNIWYKVFTNKEQTVFVTSNGKKYHRDGCQYLRQSKRQIGLSAAIDKGYTPCKVCRPS